MDHSSLVVSALAALLFAGVATAQTPSAPLPPPPPAPDAQTVAPAPAPPDLDPELEPQVTVIQRENETVEEFRAGGELRFIKVTPKHGRPYYLIPDVNGATFIRRDSLDPTLKVPLWVLLSW